MCKMVDQNELYRPHNPRRAVPLIEDGQARVVLLAWAFCTLALGLLIHTHGVSLPYGDDLVMDSVASGREPVTLAWLWTPQNEHRQPLLRWAVVALGRVAS